MQQQCGNVEMKDFLSKDISSNQLFSDLLRKTLLSRNFCQKSVRVNFRNFHTVEQSWIIADQRQDSKHFDMVYLSNLTNYESYWKSILNRSLKKKCDQTWKAKKYLWNCLKFANEISNFSGEVWWRPFFRKLRRYDIKFSGSGDQKVS